MWRAGSSLPPGFQESSLLNGRRKEEGGLAPATVQGVHVVLRKALGDAEDAGLIPRNPAEISTDPFALMHVVYLAVRMALEHIPPDGVVTVDVAQSGPGHEITISSSGTIDPEEPDRPDHALLRRLAADIGAAWIDPRIRFE